MVRTMRIAKRQNDAGIVTAKIDEQKIDVLRGSILEFVGKL